MQMFGIKSNWIKLYPPFRLCGSEQDLELCKWREDSVWRIRSGDFGFPCISRADTTMIPASTPSLSSSSRYQQQLAAESVRVFWGYLAPPTHPRELLSSDKMDLIGKNFNTKVSVTTVIETLKISSTTPMSQKSEISILKSSLFLSSLLQVFSLFFSTNVFIATSEKRSHGSHERLRFSLKIASFVSEPYRSTKAFYVYRSIVNSSFKIDIGKKSKRVLPSMRLVLLQSVYFQSFFMTVNSAEEILYQTILIPIIHFKINTPLLSGISNSAWL